MRILLAAIFLTLPGFCNATTLPPQFESSSVNASGITCLKAARTYSSINPQARAEAIGLAAGALGLAPDKPIAVEFSGGSELWTIKDGRPVKLDAWSDKELPLGPNSRTAGRWFGSVGIQKMAGGDFPSSTMNLRFGSTLYQGRYDLAYTYDYYKNADAISYRASMGLVGRALLPLNRIAGWNIGAQLTWINNYGVHEGAAGLVTGLNFYLPRGSFDVTLSFKDKGEYGLLAGYTVFITK